MKSLCKRVKGSSLPVRPYRPGEWSLRLLAFRPLAADEAETPPTLPQPSGQRFTDSFYG